MPDSASLVYLCGYWLRLILPRTVLIQRIFLLDSIVWNGDHAQRESQMGFCIGTIYLKKVGKAMTDD